MKVTHIVIFENYQEGFAYQENLLTQKHKQMGYDVSIIASQNYRDNNYVPHKRKAVDYVNEYGIPVYVLPSSKHNPHLERFFDHTVGLYEKLEAIGPDIIFLHNFSGKDVRHVVRFKKEHPDVKLYVDCHSDYYNRPVKTFPQRINAWGIRRYGRQLVPYAERFWGTIPWRVQYLQEVYRIPTEKTGLLIMGADESHIIGRDRLSVRQQLRQKFGIPQGVFLVSTGGKLDKRKQQDLLMEAVRNLEAENVWLIIFGEATEEMKPVFAQFKPCRNIIQTGWLPSDRAYDIFMASDLAFFPGTHSVLWEQAAACGTPLVVKHWGGMEHVNVDGNAVLLDDVSVETIRQTIVNIKAESRYAAMREKAAESASAFYLSEIAKRAIGETL